MVMAVYELQTAIRVHGNAIEYIPISLILLLLMEMNGAQVWMIHICGLIPAGEYCTLMV